jgi:hypothetical protein
LPIPNGGHPEVIFSDASLGIITSWETPVKATGAGKSSQPPGAPARVAQASCPRRGPVGFPPPERFFDANAKGRYLAPQGIELRVHLRVLDTPDHLVEGSFKSLQDGGDKEWIEHHR